jgi:hypothetical protein
MLGANHGWAGLPSEFVDTCTGVGGCAGVPQCLSRRWPSSPSSGSDAGGQAYFPCHKLRAFRPWPSTPLASCSSWSEIDHDRQSCDGRPVWSPRPTDERSGDELSYLCEVFGLCVRRVGRVAANRCHRVCVHGHSTNDPDASVRRTVGLWHTLPVHRWLAWASTGCAFQDSRCGCGTHRCVGRDLRAHQRDR